MTEILKVSTESNPNLVAGALVNILKEKENVEICENAEEGDIQ